MERLAGAPEEINEHYADIIDFSIHMPGCRYNGDNRCTCFAKERIDALLTWAAAHGRQPTQVEAVAS